MRWLMTVVILAAFAATLLGAVDLVSPAFAEHRTNPDQAP